MYCFKFLKLIEIFGLQSEKPGQMPKFRKTAWTPRQAGRGLREAVEKSHSEPWSLLSTNRHLRQKLSVNVKSYMDCRILPSAVILMNWECAFGWSYCRKRTYFSFHTYDATGEIWQYRLTKEHCDAIRMLWCDIGSRWKWFSSLCEGKGYCLDLLRSKLMLFLFWR